MNMFVHLSIACLVLVSSTACEINAAQVDGEGVLCQDDYLGTLVDSSVLCVAVDGDRAYVMAWYEGLQIYDVSDPISPVLIGTYPEFGNVLANGDKVYIARDYGIDVVDVSDPSAPVSLGFFQGEQYYTFPLNGWELVDHVIYMASSQVGLMLFDVSDPANIVQLETYGGFLNVYGVLKAGSMMYVARDNALEVLDVSEPESPVLAHTMTWADLYQYTAVSGSFMYLVDNSGLSIFDISNPAEMNLIGSIVTNFPKRDHTNVYAADGRVYLSTFGSVEVIDVVDPTNPTYLGTYSIPARNTATIGQVGYVASWNGLFLLDVSDPRTPAVGFVDTVGEARSVLVDQGYAYIADDYRNQTSGTNGLRIVDVSTPETPVLVGSLDINGPTRNLEIDGGLIYTADGYFGFHVIDVSAPESPTVLGGYDTVRDTKDLAVQNGIVYVADEFSFLVFDASDPANIELLATEGIDAAAVAVRDSIAYVAESRVGVHAFDVSDPSSPVLLGSYIPDHFSSESSGFGIEIIDNQLFVIDGSGLTILDVDDPSKMVFVAEYEADLHHGIFVEGNTAYVVDDQTGLQLLDIGTPGEVSLIGSYHVPWGASDVFVIDELAYVVDGDGGGLHIVNISDTCAGCLGDMNNDSVLDFFDVSLFLAAFAAMDSPADFNNDGIYDFFDVSAFLTAFSSGCP